MLLAMKPGLLSFLLGHLLVGILAGWSLLGLLLWFDVAGLKTLIQHSRESWLVVALLLFGFAITFGSLAMGTGVMGLKHRKEQDPEDGGHLAPAPARTRRR